MSALSKTRIQLCQHVLTIRVREGVAEGKVSGGTAAVQKAVHKRQDKLGLHHLDKREEEAEKAMSGHNPGTVAAFVWNLQVATADH